MTSAFALGLALHKISSYCVTDPKGTIVIECGKMLEDNGYEIKILNTINFKKSMKYNPFAYLRSEKRVFDDSLPGIICWEISRLRLGKR